MYDLDFIIAEKTQLRKKSIYVYDTQAFKIPFLSRFQKQVEGRGYTFVKPKTNSDVLDMQQPSFFGSRCFHLELSKFSDIQFLGDLQSEEDRYLLTLSEDYLKTVEKQKVFQEFLASAQLFKETPKTRTQFPAILGYALQGLDLKEEQISNYTIFKVSLEDLFFNHSENVCDFLNKFERFVSLALEYSPSGIEFNSVAFRSFLKPSEKIDYFQTHRQVYNFLRQPSENTRSDLFQHLVDLCQHEPATRLHVNTIYRVLFELSEINVSYSKGPQPEFTDYKKKILGLYKDLRVNNLLYFLLGFTELEAKFNQGNFLLQFQRFTQNILKVLEKK